MNAMNPILEESVEDQTLDVLWRLIAVCQAMTDRLMAQHERTRRACFCSAAVPDPYHLSELNRLIRAD